jgi:hypothetical protein
MITSFLLIGGLVCRYQIPATRSCWSGDNQGREAVASALEMYRPSWGRSLQDNMHRFQSYCCAEMKSEYFDREHQKHLETLDRRQMDRSIEEMAYSMSQMQETIYRMRKANENQGFFACFSWLCCRK